MESYSELISIFSSDEHVSVKKFINNMINMLEGGNFREAGIVMKNEMFLCWLCDTSQFTRDEVSCLVEAFLEFLQFPDIRSDVLHVLKMFTSELVEDGSLTEGCLVTIGTFLLGNSSKKLYLCGQVVSELMVANPIFWEEAQMMLMGSFTNEFRNAELRNINCRLVLLLYQLQPSLLVKLLNFLAAPLESGDRDLRVRCVGLLLRIFTGDHPELATGFHKLWLILCQTMRDKSLRHLVARYAADVLVKLPLFRATFCDVLEYHLKRRKTAVAESIYRAIAHAVEVDRSVFLNDSYFILIMNEGIRSLKNRRRVSLLLAMAKIFQSNLFCNHIFRDDVQERKWEADNATLLNWICSGMLLISEKVSLRAVMKDVIWKYLVPACMPAERRAKVLLDVWLKMSMTSRQLFGLLASDSNRVRISILQMLAPAQSTTPGHPSVRKMLSSLLGAESDVVMTLVTFLKTEKVSGLLSSFFAEDCVADASRCQEIADQIRDAKRFGKEGKVLNCILSFMANSFNDRNNLLILLDEMTNLRDEEDLRAAFDLLDYIASENALPFLQSTALMKMQFLAKKVGTVHILGILEKISKIPEFVLRVDEQVSQRNRYIVEVAKRGYNKLCARMINLQ